jgi:hypothetical protein
MEKELEERFKAQLARYVETRDDLETPTTLTAGYVLSNFGTELDAIEPFTTELTAIVDKMKEELANEVRILEGTEVPEYKQNELSEEKLSEEEWRTFLRNGSSRTVRLLTSTPVLSSSSSSARPNSPGLDTLDCVGTFCERSTPSCWVTSDGCGCATAAMNESSECTVPTISEPTPGTPSEAK